MQIAKSILATLQANYLPPVYGFVNTRRLTPADPPDVSTNTRSMTTDDPDYAFLTAWTAAGEPLGNHTANHLSLNAVTPQVFEQNILDDEATLTTLMAGKDGRWSASLTFRKAIGGSPRSAQLCRPGRPSLHLRSKRSR